MLGYFGVFLIDQTLTWTTGSLTCACVCDVFACVYTGGVWFIVWRTFVKFAQNLTPEKSWSGCKAYHITVTHPFGDHALSCLILAFDPPNDVLQFDSVLVHSLIADMIIHSLIASVLFHSLIASVLSQFDCHFHSWIQVFACALVTCVLNWSRRILRM